MRMLQLITSSVWALFTLAFIMLVVAEFRLFYLLMAIGCGGVSTISFLLYRWSESEKNEMSYGDDDDRNW